MNKIEINELGDTGMYYITTSKDNIVTNGSIISEEHLRFIKKKVFDDIDLIAVGLYHKKEYKKLKERHLSTFQEKRDIIMDKSKSAKYDKLGTLH